MFTKKMAVFVKLFKHQLGRAWAQALSTLTFVRHTLLQAKMYLYGQCMIKLRVKMLTGAIWIIVRKIENETFVDLETVCNALLRHQQRFCGVGRGEWTWPPGLRGLPWLEKCRYLLHRAARACPGAADSSKWPVGMLVCIMVDAISELHGPDVVCNTSDSH
jgi:hypothetical protein